jgi:hypothetical protein
VIDVCWFFVNLAYASLYHLIFGSKNRDESKQFGILRNEELRGA